MNKKGKELMGKLDGCKIIPETYIKHLESVQLVPSIPSKIIFLFFKWITIFWII